MTLKAKNVASGDIIIKPCSLELSVMITHQISCYFM